MQKRILFLDGAITPVSDAFIQTLSPGFLSGRGVFETMRVYSGKIFALQEHLQRLKRGLKALRIKSPYTKTKLTEQLYLALRSNKLKNARLRLTVWQAHGRVRISIIALPYKPYSKAKYTQGFRAIISDVKRDERTVLPLVKSISYLSLMMARRKARAKGNDEAVLLNRKGHLTEGSYANIFFIKDKKLYTPACRCGCLNGITRQFVLKVAKNLRIKCHERAMTPQKLFEADEAFLTNSLIEIMPLTVVQGQMIGNGKVGLITKKITEGYKKIVKDAR